MKERLITFYFILASFDKKSASWKKHTDLLNCSKNFSAVFCTMEAKSGVCCCCFWHAGLPAAAALLLLLLFGASMVAETWRRVDSANDRNSALDWCMGRGHDWSSSLVGSSVVVCSVCFGSGSGSAVS